MQIYDIPKLFHYNRILILLWVVLVANSADGQSISAADNYARNRAGVVMVKTQLSAIVNVSQLQINNKAFKSLLDSIQALQVDSMRLTAEQRLNIVLARFRLDANKYFRSTLSYFRYAKQITSTGTGFFIHEDGYVLTNCHVVDESDSYIRRRLISSVFRQVTASNIKAIESSWQVDFSETQRDELYNTFADIYSSILPISLDSLKKSIYVVVGGDETGGTYGRELPATIVVKGRSMPGKDVAILKMKVPGPYPTIQMADETNTRVGERVFVYGYPETVTNNEFLSKSTALEPTLTNGIVSAWKRTIFNWPVMQMDANINSGNSGGPVCNDEGQVIGMTTFGSYEARTGGLAAGFNFAIPLSVIQEFLDLAAVRPKQSEITIEFNEAISWYNKKYYKRAQMHFSEVQKKYPGYPGIDRYLEDCKLGILDKRDKEPNNYYYLIVVVGAVLTVAFFTLWLNLRKKTI